MKDPRPQGRKVSRGWLVILIAGIILMLTGLLMGILGLSPLSVGLTPQAILTGSWQIETRQGNNTTVEFAPDDDVSVSVLPPSSLAQGATRVLVVQSEKRSEELLRYTMGYYPSGPQDPNAPAFNKTFSLEAHNLTAGDVLTLRVMIAQTGAVEYSKPISVAADIQGMIDEKAQQLLTVFLSEIQKRDRIISLLARDLDAVTKLAYTLAVALFLVGAYATRGMWYKKAEREQARTNTQFDSWLAEFIRERKG